MTRRLRVLLVEDNPGDARLTAEALGRDATGPELDIVGDGEEALAFLRNEGLYAGRPFPDLVLLDLNLPKKDGTEVLAEMDDPALRGIPVVVFTSSSAKQDITLCYEHGANAYVTKPIEMAEFMSAVGSISDFWLNTARLPCGAGQEGGNR